MRFKGLQGELPGWLNERKKNKIDIDLLTPHQHNIADHMEQISVFI